MILKNLEANINTLIRENNIDFHIINTHTDLRLEDLIASDALIFRSDRVSQIKVEIEKIRRADNPRLYLKPIFVSARRVYQRLDNEVDGVVEGSDLDTIEEKTKELIQNIKEINPQPISSAVAFNDRVLLKTMQYMFTRGIDLKPKRSRSSLMGYHYPFVRNMIPDFEVPVFLDKLNIATKKNWFNTKLEDRVNLCKSCGSSYLHFVETCHKCNSIDIDAEHLIHHFRCAYIGPQSDFDQDEIMVCPKCDKVLRHIGVDYDKPSEILSCNSCNHQAQQSSIKAKCIDCGDENELSKLHSKEVPSLSLTSEGKDIARSGRSFDLVEDVAQAQVHKYELDGQVFDLLRNQEIKKSASNTDKSYIVKIDFNESVLDELTVAERLTFTNEFKNILGNYLDDVDLMTMRSISKYEILMNCKPAEYAEDMQETIRYNITKIIDDNFNDPEHALKVELSLLDENFVG